MYVHIDVYTAQTIMRVPFYISPNLGTVISASSLFVQASQWYLHRCRTLRDLASHVTFTPEPQRAVVFANEIIREYTLYESYEGSPSFQKVYSSIKPYWAFK